MHFNSTNHLWISWAFVTRSLRKLQISSLRRILRIACWVIVSSFGSAVLSVEPDDQMSILGRSLYCGAAENNLLIRNFDVLIDENYVLSPSDAETERLVPVTEEKIKSRVVIDRKKETCCVMRKTYYDVMNGTASAHFPAGASWTLSGYFDKHQIERSLQVDVGTIKSNKYSFVQFCLSDSIPFVEMSNVWHFSRLSKRRYEDEVEYSLGLMQNCRIRTFADGTRIVSFIIASTPNTRTEITFHPRTSMPIRYVRRKVISDSESYVEYSQSIIQEESDGIYRTIKLLREGKKFGPEHPSESRLLLLNYTGEVTISWLQFNEDALKFPELDLLGRNGKRWAEFLQITPDQ